MNRVELVKYFEDVTANMVKIMKAKNEDYAGTVSDDAFANFTRVEVLGIASTEQGFLTRMTDKVCRVISFVQRGVLSVKDETVEDTLIDLANYALLMAAYIKSRRAKDGNTGTVAA